MDEIDPLQARRRHIVAVCADVFLRYGYARTTMGDIAQAAGLSRPTLYAAFADKEAVFAAVIHHLVQVNLADIRQGLARHRSVARKLRYACTAWGVAGFELVRANPESKDVFDLSFPAVRQSHEVFEAFLVELLSPHWPADGPPLPGIAHMVGAAIKGFKALAQTSDELRQMIEDLTDLVAGQTI
ncbi:MAG: TetR/AcrR family transcriptional regulator [Pseudomonadota bacterium]|nr:TetR/AcrR family transcriptional regulator [Pseudomonadota bacterium]